ncbi:MAG: ABC transporter ATP-binding protein [Chloroflexota bacterium]|nr:ABC transporter ATP-binding protein [Chloroflexota bacterium]
METVPSRAAPTLASGTPIIEMRGLVKRYGAIEAVAGIDLVVNSGEIFGILGPNGAGKTTTLEMIEGLRIPDAGTIHVAGHDAVRESGAVRRIIGVQLQTTALFDYLTASELISLFAGLYDVPAPPERVDALLRLVGLTEKPRARVNTLSGGQKQRLSIALALVNQPRVVFLDEPTTGLDPQARRMMWETIRGVRAAGATVVLTTHYMEEAETLCDRVAIMDRGRIIALDTPAALIRGLNMAATIQTRAAPGTLSAAVLATLPNVTETDLVPESPQSDLLRLRTTDAQTTLIGLLDLATRQNVTLTDLGSTQANLEDVFLSLTGRTYE